MVERRLPREDNSLVRKQSQPMRTERKNKETN